MSYTIGLDGGSTYLKGALLKGRQVVETMVCSTGIDNNGSAEQMLGQLCQKAGIARSDIRYTMATGYSRKVLTVADDDISEITAHAYGVRVTAPKEYRIAHLRHTQSIRQEVLDGCPDQTAELSHSLLVGKAPQPAAHRVLHIDLLPALQTKEGVNSYTQLSGQDGQQFHIRRTALLPFPHGLGRYPDHLTQLILGKATLFP